MALLKENKNKPKALEILPYNHINTMYKTLYKHYVDCPYIVFIYDCKVEFQAPVNKLASKEKKI